MLANATNIVKGGSVMREGYRAGTVEEHRGRRRQGQAPARASTTTSASCTTGSAPMSSWKGTIGERAHHRDRRSEEERRDPLRSAAHRRGRRAGRDGRGPVCAGRADAQEPEHLHQAAQCHDDRPREGHERRADHRRPGRRAARRAAGRPRHRRRGDSPDPHPVQPDDGHSRQSTAHAVAGRQQPQRHERERRHVGARSSARRWRRCPRSSRRARRPSTPSPMPSTRPSRCWRIWSRPPSSWRTRPST